jgi:hypothetical protein
MRGSVGGLRSPSTGWVDPEYPVPWIPGEDPFVADIKLVDFGLSTFIPNKHLQAEAKSKEAVTRSVREGLSVAWVYVSGCYFQQQEMCAVFGQYSHFCQLYLRALRCFFCPYDLHMDPVSPD